MKRVKIDIGFGIKTYTVHLGLYQNGALALYLEDNENIRYFLSTNLGFVPEDTIYLDINNMPTNIGNILEKLGFGTVSSYTQNSGWIEYPLFFFNDNVIEKIDYDIAKKYHENYYENSTKAILNDYKGDDIQ